jgi:cold shock CspA family protein
LRECFTSFSANSFPQADQSGSYDIMSAENNASETAAQSAPSQNNKREGGNKRYNTPDKPIMQARNKTGTVKWFSFKNGYGFITVDDDGDDIFVHRSEFIREGAREVFYHVEVGDRLEFDIINRAKGREAVAVTGPNGVRIPGSPANFNRRGRGGRYNNERRNRNTEEQFVDASEEHHDEEAENKPPNGEAKKRGGRGGGNRRRNASNEENSNQQSGGENAGGDKKGRRVRKNTGRQVGRGPRNAEQSNGQGQQEQVQDSKE